MNAGQISSAQSSADSSDQS